MSTDDKNQGGKGKVVSLFPKKPPEEEVSSGLEISSSPTTTYTEGTIAVPVMEVKGQVGTNSSPAPKITQSEPPNPPVPPTPPGGTGNGGERKSSPLAMAVLFGLSVMVVMFLGSLNSQNKESTKMAEVVSPKPAVKPVAEMPQVTIASSSPQREIPAVPIVPMVSRPPSVAKPQKELALFSDNCPEESCVGVNRGDFQLKSRQQITFIEADGINFAVKLRGTPDICTNNAYFAQNVVLQDDFFKGFVVEVSETCGRWLQSKNIRTNEAITIRTEGNQLVRVRFEPTSRW